MLRSGRRGVASPPMSPARPSQIARDAAKVRGSRRNGHEKLSRSPPRIEGRIRTVAPWLLWLVARITGVSINTMAELRTGAGDACTKFRDEAGGTRIEGQHER